jgi:CheY-like chemotaxis protein
MFVIELPNVVSVSTERISTPMGITTSAPSVEQNVDSHPRILLVDDHIDSVRPMQLFLEEIGYQVTTAHSVATALRAATQEEFDLLVSDIGLPDGSGEDIIRQLKDKGHKLPGIALSGYGTEEDLARSRAAGFQVHLTKPVSPEHLRTTVDGLLANRQSSAPRI